MPTVPFPTLAPSTGYLITLPFQILNVSNLTSPITLFSFSLKKKKVLEKDLNFQHFQFYYKQVRQTPK